MLRVMIVDENRERSAPLKQYLDEAGYTVVGHLSDTADLNKAVAQMKPDVIIIDTESPSRDTLEHICVVSRDDPRAIVMFSHDGETEKIRAATRAGVSAYVVGSLESARLRPILDAALVRFEEYQALKNELEMTATKLAERKTIDRAKGILMKQRGLDEDAAYQSLRKLAMQRGMRMGEIAQQVIQAAELLS
jgi:response regulator NasT